MKKVKPSDVIPKRINIYGVYHINVEWEALHYILNRYKKTYNLELNPDFQRGHVWTEQQQIAYVEYALSGGYSGKDIFFNYPNWQKDYNKNNVMVCVDGLQRLTAVQKFMANDLKVFQKYYANDFTCIPTYCDFIFYVNGLKNYADVLKWYLEMNSGGTPHSQEELDRVRALYDKQIKTI